MHTMVTTRKIYTQSEEKLVNKMFFGHLKCCSPVLPAPLREAFGVLC